MRVAMIGLGKLGLPVSCAMVMKGHQVFGYDINKELTEQLKNGNAPYYEPNLNNILKECLEDGLTICDSVKEAAMYAEIVFIAVPTPSNDDDSFDTRFVQSALSELARQLKYDWRYRVISVISTVLPGTCREEFLPILSKEFGNPSELNCGFCYNAQFIAMGTTIHDMLNPEFVLIGEYDQQSGDVLGAFYSQLVDAPLLRMSIESAETVKMAYNTMIGFKIVYANTLMELCDKVPHADCDEVYGAISKANKRLLSPRYLRGGMGDGGGCHPRDNRALSFLARGLGLSANPFDFVMDARIKQSRHLAEIVFYNHQITGLPIVVMGLTFKPETNLTLDSPSFLLMEHLAELGATDVKSYDPIIKAGLPENKPSLYVIATNHQQFKSFPWAEGSVIIDPWRMLDNAPEGCSYRPIGK